MNTFESSGVNDLIFCLWVLLARSKPRTVLPRPMVMRPPRLARHPAREAFFGVSYAWRSGTCTVRPSSTAFMRI